MSAKCVDQFYEFFFVLILFFQRGFVRLFQSIGKNNSIHIFRLDCEQGENCRRYIDDSRRIARLFHQTID